MARLGSRERNPLRGFRLSALIPDAVFGFLLVGQDFRPVQILDLKDFAFQDGLEK